MEGCPADRNWFTGNPSSARPRAGYKIQSLLIGEYIRWVLESSSHGLLPSRSWKKQPPGNF